LPEYNLLFPISHSDCSPKSFSTPPFIGLGCVSFLKFVPHSYSLLFFLRQARSSIDLTHSSSFFLSLGLVEPYLQAFVFHLQDSLSFSLVHPLAPMFLFFLDQQLNVSSQTTPFRNQFVSQANE